MPKITANKVNLSGMIFELESKQITGTNDKAAIPTTVPPIDLARDSLERLIGSSETTEAIAPKGIEVPV